MKFRIMVSLCLFSLLCLTGLNLDLLGAQSTKAKPKAPAAAVSIGPKAIDSVYSIKTAEELRWLVNNKSTYEGMTIRLEADIDFGEAKPLATGFKEFRGVFDGNGKTVRNFRLTTPLDSYEGRGSAFIFVNSGTVSNLTLEGSIKGSIELALLVGTNSGTIENCVTRGLVSVGGGTAGGLVCNNSGTIKGCTNYATVITSNDGEASKCGGIAAINGEKIELCSNYGAITGSTIIGGIVAVMDMGSRSQVVNCTNYGKVTGNSTVGGIIGGSNIFSYTVEGCVNAGVVWASTENCGGIVGAMLSSGNTVRNCRNAGLVSGGLRNTGGIIGLESANSSNVLELSSNTGIVEGRGKNVGGIIGLYSSKFRRCWNFGQVSGIELVGGIAGNLSISSYDKTMLAECYNAGPVGAETKAGGIIPVMNPNQTIRQCYNSGAISADSFAGGITGHLVGIVQNCYNTGSINGQTMLGGISGASDNLMIGTPSRMESCYNTGLIAANGISSQLGASFLFSPPIKTNYYLARPNDPRKGMRTYGDIPAVDTHPEDPSLQWARGLKASEFASSVNFEGFDFTSTWVMGTPVDQPEDSSASRPLLRGIGEADAPKYLALLKQAAEDQAKLTQRRAELATGPSDSGPVQGSPIEPVNGVYTINTADELAWLIQQKNNYKGQTLVLAADIDFGKDRIFTQGFARMAGTLDGAGHSIKNLVIEPDNSVWLDSFPQSIGLVSVIEPGGVVQNLHIASGKISGGYRTGGIAGHCSGTIMNCSNNATIKGLPSATVGGIVGIMDALPDATELPVDFKFSRLQGCRNSGQIIGHQASGIAGYSRTAQLIDCTNSGQVSAYYASGIVHSSLPVVACSNSGQIGLKDSRCAAGIVDIDNACQNEYSGLVLNCSNSGTIIADLMAAGIIIESSGNILNCSNTGAISSTNADRESGSFPRVENDTGSYAVAAGIVGKFHAPGVLVNCANYGAINSKVSAAGGLIGVDHYPQVADYEMGPDYQQVVVMYNCLSMGDVISTKGLAGSLIGEKLYMAFYSNPTPEAVMRQAEGVYYLKTANINANIPAINFPERLKSKLPLAGFTAFGEEGLKVLPAGWDTQVWTIEPAAGKSLARPVLDIGSQTVHALKPLAPGQTGPGTYLIGGEKTRFGAMILDKGRVDDGWRYLEMYTENRPQVWQAELNMVAGPWFFPEAPELENLWKTFFTGAVNPLPAGLYYLVPEHDSAHGVVMDFFTGQRFVVPKNLQAFSIALHRY